MYRKLNKPKIHTPMVNHITKFYPSLLLQAAMDLAPTMTDVASIFNMFYNL
jgi:hypothetical protein